MPECIVEPVSWVVPVMSGEMTLCEQAQAITTMSHIGVLAAGLTIFLLAIIAFRGR